MILKTLSLASALVLLVSSPSLAQQQKQPTGGPKSPQQSKVAPDPSPLEIKGDRIGETLEEFKKRYPQSKCERPSEKITECQQNIRVSLAGEQTTDMYCDPDVRDSRSIQNCLFQGVHARFEADKLKTLLYALPTGGLDQVCESFIQKYGKPNNVTESEGTSNCSWWSGEVFLQVLHTRPPVSKEREDLYVTILLSDSSPSKDI